MRLDWRVGWRHSYLNVKVAISITRESFAQVAQDNFTSQMIVGNLYPDQRHGTQRWSRMRSRGKAGIRLVSRFAEARRGARGRIISVAAGADPYAFLCLEPGGMACNGHRSRAHSRPVRELWACTPLARRPLEVE